PPTPTVEGHRTSSHRAAGDLLLAARLALLMFLALPAELLSIAAWHSYASGVTVVALAVLAVPLTLLMAAIACRLIGGERLATRGGGLGVGEGHHVVSRWSAAYIPIWLIPEIVASASRWLYGTLFWPHWLRLAGACLGRDCEISSLIDALPATIDIGDHSFLADGIYLGGARVQRGTVTVRPVALASNVFLGNGALVPGGVRIPEGTLLGINTRARVAAGGAIADPDLLRPHTAWFGHPALRLPRRAVSAEETRRAEHPSAWRRATRLFWETARFLLP